ncbi:MAG: hypothetical protein M1826_004648 [Phylliscum demangeonii]|nr:MAG: hypothetical protein M1826_004648 [Phylliscum demangeonii]
MTPTPAADPAAAQAADEGAAAAKTAAAVDRATTAARATAAVQIAELEAKLEASERAAAAERAAFAAQTSELRTQLAVHAPRKAVAAGGDLPAPAPAAALVVAALNAPDPEGPAPVVVVRPIAARASWPWLYRVIFFVAAVLLAIMVGIAGASWLAAEREHRLWASANAIPHLCRLCAAEGREPWFDKAKSVWSWASGASPEEF